MRNMTLVFLNPWALALVALVALAIALHAMQSRRRRVTVPSLMIWKRVAARGLVRRSRRFRLDLPLLLMIAAALALVFASARPEVLGLREYRGLAAVVVDNGTASLAEHSPGPSRLDYFREAAAERMRGAEAMVIATSPEPAIIAGAASGGELARALARVQAVEKTGPLDAAVALAISRGAERVIVTSGRELAHAMAEVEFVRPLHAGGNLAIVRADFSEEAAFIAVKSYARGTRTVRARMSVVEPSPGAVIAEASLEVPPGGTARAILRPVPGRNEAWRSAEAVKIELDGPDALAADDTVYAARGLARPLRVGVWGGPCEPLERAFRASGVEVTALAGESTAGWENVDVLVAIGGVPEGFPPDRPLFLVAPSARWGPIRVEGPSAEAARAALADAPMLQGFPPVEFTVARSRPAAIMARHDRLIVSDEGSTLAALVGGGHRMVVLAFRPEDSDWPSRASFPVFVHRALRELMPASNGSALDHVRVGSSPAERLPAPAGSVALPGGPELPATARALRSGLYRVSASPEGPRFIAVNLLSESESDIATVRDGGSEGGAALAAAGKNVAARGLARAAVLAAALFLAAEWVLGEYATARFRRSRTS